MRTWPTYLCRMLLLLLVSLPSFAQNDSHEESVESVLLELDETIKHRHEYDQAKEETLQKLKAGIPLAGNDSVLYKLYSRLFQAYYNYQTDSAMHYVNLQQRLVPKLSWNAMNEVRMNKSELFSTMGMYKEAIDALESINRSALTSEEVERFMSLYNSVCSLVAAYSLTDQEQEKYIKMGDAYRDTLLMLYNKENPEFIRFSAGRANEQKEYTESIELLKQTPSSLLHGHLEGLVAFDMASAYEGMGNIDREIYYLAKSAIVDLRLSIKEYVALHKLAILLFRQGQIERAYTYLKCSMDDAVFCNARFRAISITQAYPIIDKAYQMRAQSEERVRTAFMWAIVFFAFFLFVALIYIYRQMQRLRVARSETSRINEQLNDLNKQLSEVNKELSLANSIKQDSLVHYLEQCSMYLDKMENYRRSLENLAISSDIKGLFKAIKSEAFIGEERGKFYRSFDETFLSLFPHFVESFNRLLRDDEHIYPKNDELLSTELRIFALIRLGITDSNKIARFLRYSLITIYNYRSKVRNKAKDKKMFEEQVEKIEG